MAVKVDLDLFVNSASKGWNDGAKVDSPFAAFVGGLAKGIDQNYDNALKAEQTEAQRIQNEQAPYREAVLEAQATEAQFRTDAMNENPEAFKDTIIREAEAARAKKEQAAAYETKKAKLTEIYQSGDGAAIGNAYISREFKDVFTKDKSLDEMFKSAYPNWAKDTKQTYQAEQRQLREIDTNESLYEESVKTYEKFTPDYVQNRDINILKEMIQADTGTPVSDSELFEKGVMAPFTGPKQIPQKVPVVDPVTGKPVLEADGKIPKMQIAPAGKWGVPYVDDPFSNDAQERVVFEYGGKKYQVGSGINTDTSRLFNTMQSSYRRKNYLDKGQGGTADLTFQDVQKTKTETEITAKAQADANRSSEQIQKETEEFIRGSDLATQKWAEKEKLIGDTPKATGTPVATVTPTATSTGPSAPIATPIPQMTPQSDKVTRPEPAATYTPQVLPTAIVGPTMSQAPIPTPSPLSPAQQNQLIKKQAEAVKGNQFLSKYQKAPDKEVTPPLSPVAQAEMTTKSPYIPAKLITNIQYQPDVEAITRVAANPVMFKLSSLTKAIATHESLGRNSAKSPTGTLGVMQVTGPTGRSINPDFDRTSEVQQAIAGARILSLLNERYPNSPMLALTAYNAGTVVVNEAVRLAGTSNWSVVRDYMTQAGESERVQNAWYSDFIRAGFSDAKARKLARGKVKEAQTYAEKVIVNFPAFAQSEDDNRVIDLLKQQGVFEV